MKKTAYKVRGDGDADEEEKGEELRELDEYVGVIAKQTELFSTFDADEIFTTLKEFGES